MLILGLGSAASGYVNEPTGSNAQGLYQTNTPELRNGALRAQIKKERNHSKRVVKGLRRELRQTYKGSSLDAIRFGAMVTGGSYRQGVALVNCETGGTFSPNAWNPTPLGGSHATGLWQWLFPSTWLNTGFNRFGNFDPRNPWVQSVASYELRRIEGSWEEAWEDDCGRIADATPF